MTGTVMTYWNWKKTLGKTAIGILTIRFGKLFMYLYYSQGQAKHDVCLFKAALKIYNALK